MSSKKKDEDEKVHSISETKNLNNIKVYKDPLFNIGDIVKHRIYPFRGVIVDVDPEFSNTEEWYQSIPAEIRPSRNQPYYHLMAENTETFYTAYVSQQNLVDDGENGPLEHPDLGEIFSIDISKRKSIEFGPLIDDAWQNRQAIARVKAKRCLQRDCLPAIGVFDDYRGFANQGCRHGEIVGDRANSAFKNAGAIFIVG